MHLTVEYNIVNMCVTGGSALTSAVVLGDSFFFLLLFFFPAVCAESRPPQSDATGELVENTLPVEVSSPGASDVLAAAVRKWSTDGCGAEDGVSFTCRRVHSDVPRSGGGSRGVKN